VNVITHSLLPITAKQIVELRQAQLPAYRTQLRHWAVVGIFGSLPDILDPHISLGARCDSFSHAWPFTMAVLLACGIYGILARRRESGRLALWGAAAYAAHVLGDIVSGGLDFFRTGRAIGDYWITPCLWPVSDLLFIVAFILLNRIIRTRHGLIPSVVRALGERLHGDVDPQK